MPDLFFKWFYLDLQGEL